MDHRYIFYMVVGYLAGSMLFALEYPKIFKGVDVRRLSEDGNPGTYNAFVYGGIGCGILTLLSELAKGFMPVFLCGRQLGMDSLWFAGVMAAPVAGHAFSIFHRGKGGKAIAVSFGVLAGLFPVYRPFISLVIFYLLFSLVLPVRSHRKRSLITFACVGLSCFFTAEPPAVLAGVLLLSGIVVYKHCICTEEESREENAAV